MDSFICESRDTVSTLMEQFWMVNAVDKLAAPGRGPGMQTSVADLTSSSWISNGKRPMGRR